MDTIHRTEDLFTAIKDGKIATVSALLHLQGVSVNSRNKYDSTPLHEAAKCGFREIFKLLLDFGGEVNARTKHGSTPLYEAVRSPYCKEEIVRQLLGAGADPNVPALGHTPLHEAISSEKLKIMRILVDGGADVNAKDPGGKTLLHKATEIGNPAIVRTLVKAGADLNLADGYGRTALHALIHGSANEKIFKLLLELGALADTRDDLENTPLHDAVRLHDGKIVKLLVGAGVDVNVRDGYGNPALHHAVGSLKFDVVKLLLGAGAHVNARDGQNRTVLHLVATKKYDKMIEYLLSKGAEDGFERIAAKECKGKSFLNMARVLLKNGADVQAVDDDGLTPIQILERNSSANTEVLELFSRFESKEKVDDGEMIQVVVVRKEETVSLNHAEVVFKNLRLEKKDKNRQKKESEECGDDKRDSKKDDVCMFVEPGEKESKSQSQEEKVKN